MVFKASREGAVALSLLLIGNCNYAKASPVDSMASLKCSCYTFTPAQIPRTCSIPDSQNLSWESARELASAYRIPMSFDSEMVVSRILESVQPLPTSVLSGISEQPLAAREEVATVESKDRIICDIVEDVQPQEIVEQEDIIEQPEIVEQREPIERQETMKTDPDEREIAWLVLQICATALLFMYLYAHLERAWLRSVLIPIPSLRFIVNHWSRYRRRYILRAGSIRLAGEEAQLTAKSEEDFDASLDLDLDLNDDDGSMHRYDAEVYIVVI